jgi:DNA-binding PadR family transcriptional regulator
MPKTDATGEPRRRRKPKPFERPSGAMILAAFARAELHTERKDMGLGFWQPIQHLGFKHSPWTTRRLRPTIERMEAEGLVVRSRRLGIQMWALTSRGRRRLTRARAAGEVGPLPEAPQHRRWKEAREAASKRIGEFQADLRSTVDEIVNLLDGDELAADSETWFTISERLRTCWLLGSATYCLREWPEPDDSKADIEKDRRRLGRRAHYYWDLRLNAV